jgi:hypothetical protein
MNHLEKLQIVTALQSMLVQEFEINVLSQDEVEAISEQMSEAYGGVTEMNADEKLAEFLEGVANLTRKMADELLETEAN